MPDLPDYAIKNRACWTNYSPSYEEPGRRAWASSEIAWGIWGVLEQDVHALGDLAWLDGKHSIELGCGTAYCSAWLARHGAKPVGIDITPAQLDRARGFQKQFGLEFPLIEGNAESVPMPDGSFDFALSEYGASIWCDPYKWVPEAARLLRTGGKLVFLRNSTISIVCSPDESPAEERLVRDWFGMHRVEYDQTSVEFHLPTADMFRLLKSNGFELEDLIDLRPSEELRETRFDYMTWEWARRWPSEEMWRLRRV